MNWENEFEKSTGLSAYTVDEKHEVCYCKEYVDWLIAKLNKLYPLRIFFGISCC